jgi:hypothetical protein
VVSALLTGTQCQKEKAPPAKSSRISEARRPPARDPGRPFADESTPVDEEDEAPFADPSVDVREYLKGIDKLKVIKIIAVIFLMASFYSEVEGR